MEITEVRIKLTEDSDDRLQAFCSVTFDDCFVVRDLKIIEGSNGPFVAMPSRKLTAHCHKCGSKNHLRANHCNQCGARQNSDRAARDHDGRSKLYADIAHPINSTCREMIQERVIAEFQSELELAKEPGYVSRYEDDYESELQELRDLAEDPPEETEQPAEQPAEEKGPAESAQRGEESPKRSTEVHQAGSGEPRAPHSSGPRKSTKPGTPHQKPDSKKPEFGAGIFDD